MRSLLMTLILATSLPMMPTVASAQSHGCSQLRQTVINRAPLTTRNLPYDALSCRSISLAYALVVRPSSNGSVGRLEDRIEAIFRREGLLR